MAEKVFALDTATFFAERAARGNLSSLQKILDRVPAATPLKGDEL